MLEVLGDDYINQHVLAAYREHVIKMSYRTYMTDAVRSLAGLLLGGNPGERWNDIIRELEYETDSEEYQEENEGQIKNRLLAKLNGKGEC